MSKIYLFSRENRLHTAADFQLCLKERNRCASSAFVALGRPNQLNHARLGIMVSKKYFARAVDRNRIKRLAREQFRQASPAFKGWDIVVLPKMQAKQLDPSAWFLDMQSLWNLCKSFFRELSDPR